MDPIHIYVLYGLAARASMARRTPTPPMLRTPPLCSHTQASAASLSSLCFLSLALRPLRPPKGDPDWSFFSLSWSLSCCTAVKIAISFQEKIPETLRPPLGARRSAPDAHDALSPRLPKHTQNNRPCRGGSLIQAASKMGAPPMPSHSSWASAGSAVVGAADHARGERRDS